MRCCRGYCFVEESGHAAAVLPTVLGQMVAARGAEESIKRTAKGQNSSLRAAVFVAGPPTRRSPESCSMTIRSGSLTHSRRRSAPTLLLRISADHWPTGRRSVWRVSAMLTRGKRFVSVFRPPTS